MGKITRTNFGLVSTVTLTNAQILTLPSVPVTVIPALPGRALMVPVVLGVGFASLVLDPLAVNYGNVNGGASFVFSLGSAPSFKVTLATGLLSGFFANAPNATVWQFAAVDTANQNNSSPNDLTDVENTPLTLSVSGNGGNFTGGDPSNVLTVTIPYMAVEV